MNVIINLKMTAFKPEPVELKEPDPEDQLFRPTTRNNMAVFACQNGLTGLAVKIALIR
jgi:hypothetical protein